MDVFGLDGEKWFPAVRTKSKSRFFDIDFILTVGGHFWGPNLNNFDNQF